MSIIRLIGYFVIILGIILIPNLTCAPKPAETPTTAPPLATTAAPEPPVLRSPANESTVSSLAVKLEWNPSADATSYGLQMSTDPSFTSLTIDQTGIANTYYELTSGLNWKTDYYWRVNASNELCTKSCTTTFSPTIFVQKVCSRQLPTITTVFYWLAGFTATR